MEQALLARGLRGLPRVLHPPVLHRAALDEAAGGRDRLGARDRPRDPCGHAARCATSRRGRASASLQAHIRWPVLVVNGTDDAVRPHDSGAAARRDRRRQPRDPRGRRATARRVATPSRSTCWSATLRTSCRRCARWTRGKSRRKRALFISSPIGLGHARRDVAIAKELRELHPDLEIDWLAQNPVTRVLEAGGRAHPSRQRATWRTSRATSSRSPPSTTCTASRRCGAWTRSSCRQLHGLRRRGARPSDYDLWIGDEAWELDYFLHENPELKQRRTTPG